MTQATKSIGFYHKETGDAWHTDCSSLWTLNPKSTRIEINTSEEAGDRKCLECGKPIASEKPRGRDVQQDHRHWRELSKQQTMP